MDIVQPVLIFIDWVDFDSLVFPTIDPTLEISRTSRTSLYQSDKLNPQMDS